MGKKAYILNNPEATDRYKVYMQQYFAPENYEFDHIVSVDTASEGMLPENAKEFIGKVELSIDHHMSNSGYAEHVCVVSDCAACGEIIYMLLMEMAGEIDKETANQLYIAVTTDTGCLVYSNTNARTIEITSKLVYAGAENAAINKALFRTKSKKRITVEGKVINGIKFFRDGTIAVASVSQELLKKTGATEEDLDDIASIPGQIEGVEAGVTIKELPDGSSKISLRTVKNVNASDVCAKFGGGGHRLAAGCSMKCGIDEAAELIAKAIDELWGK